jgi:two-component system, NtrC family, C4-dicarboxylate transport response regulator DctD
MSNLVDSRQSLYTNVPTALVIEDEAAIRQLVRRTLEPAVCRVAEAGSGEEGLRIIQQGIPHVDVVLTDLRMPGLSGWDVVEVLAKHRPDLPVGVISGYGGAAAARAQRLRARLLVKPFTHRTLVGLVAALVADARAMRARAGAHRARAERAREVNALVRQQHDQMRARLDLVAAAWDLHRQSSREDE